VIEHHENSQLMHLRLKDFNKHRLDKLNLTLPHLYEPKHPQAKQMKNLMTLLKGDPDHKKDLEFALKNGINGISKKNPDEANDDD
jgi:hypothetical protein